MFTGIKTFVSVSSTLIWCLQSENRQFIHRKIDKSLNNKGRIILQKGTIYYFLKKGGRIILE